MHAEMFTTQMFFRYVQRWRCLNLPANYCCYECWKCDWSVTVWEPKGTVHVFNKTSLDLSTLNRLFTPQTLMRTSKGGKYTCMRNLHHFRLNIISSHLKKCLSDWRRFYIELSWAYSEVDLLDVVHPCKLTHVRVALQKHFCEFN